MSPLLAIQSINQTTPTVINCARQVIVTKTKKMCFFVFLLLISMRSLLYRCYIRNRSGNLLNLVFRLMTIIKIVRVHFYG